MKRSCIALTILLLSVGSFPLLGDEMKISDEKAVKLLNALAPADAPGIQYIIVDKSGTIYSYSSGLADIKNQSPLTVNHTLSAFSMTKTLTAIAVLQLAEGKRIDIDDKISKYIEHPYNQEITIRQCVNHTSGIPNPIPLKWVHPAAEHDDFDEDAALARVLADNPKPIGKPGEKYAYSNIGYWLLGKVIEAVTHQNYRDYMTNNIFEPLKLTADEIGFEINDPTLHAKGYLDKYSITNLMKGFITDREVIGEYEGKWLHIKDVYIDGPAFGGAIGSAEAFSRILQDLLSDKSLLLNDDSRRLLYSQQKDSEGEDIEMTLGWHVDSLEGVRYYYKQGGGAGFHCEMRIYPTKGVASVIMTNRTSFNSRKRLSTIDEVFVKE